MRRLLISLSLILLIVAVPQRGFSQDPAPADAAPADTSDLFLNAYMANEQGEKLESSGEAQQALSKYRYAASLLDQISQDDPKWQPIVVDYRKKKVAGNISRLQQQLGPDAANAPAPGAPSPGPDASAVPIDGDLPQKQGGPAPDLSDGSQGQTPQPTFQPSSDSGASEQVRDQLSALRSKLKSVENEKEKLADQLTDALRQLDRSKTSETELKGQLRQAQDAYQNSISDKSQSSGSQKQYQARINQLEDALKDAEADRDAADEEIADGARRTVKARQATALMARQRDTATAHAQEMEAKYADASKLAVKLDAANKKIASLTKDRDDASQRADEAEQKLTSTKKLAAKLADAQKQIAALKASGKALTGNHDQIAGQLADAKKQIDQLTSDRDSAREQISALNGKLDDAHKEIASVKADRDQIAAQRDQALADLGKAREAQKHVDALLAENATLTQKLAADETTIQNFKSGSPEKDKQIAELRKEVSDTKALLTSTQQDRDNMQSTLNDLQQQYDSASSELAELKANSAVGATEKKALTDENDLLRGIVLRELREQARRDQAKRLVMAELSQLQVQSDTLLKRIDYLGEPVVQLTDKEKALFKDPSLDIPDADDSTMDISIAAPKESSVISIKNTTAEVPATSRAGSPIPAAVADSTPDAASASASATPMELADLANHTAPASSENAITSAEQSSPASGKSTAAATPGGETSSQGTDNAIGPMVPKALVEEAKEAKDDFDKSQYLDAEKVYEKMLTEAPSNVYILSNLGVVYFRDQKWKLAEESLKKAIAIAPQDVFSHCTLGIVYYQEKRYDDAINSLTRALAIDPKYAVAHNYLGITASQKGWQEAAKKELETAIDIDPKYGDACFNLAVVYAMQNPPDKESARKYYQRAIDDGAEPDSSLEQLVK